jgi:hypothetical protein
VRDGALAEFEAQLPAQQAYFIRKGVFLILEKLRTFVYRNLFQKACIHFDAPRFESHRLFSRFHRF